MKKFIITLSVILFFLFTFNVNAQVSITTDGSDPDGSAMLDVKSNAKGVLYPRLTTSERDAIVNPANSLMIFNTSTRCLEGYNEMTSSWEQIHCYVCPLPGDAGTITGTAMVCPDQTGVSYSVSATSSATGYTWTYSGTGFSIVSGSNTNAITANFSSATSGNLTVYGTNVCGNGTVSPAMAITVTALAGAPAAGTHVPSETQIVWNWNTVAEATGYKWNTTNDYNTAIDKGTSTTHSETGLSCNTSYTRYVWAYNPCGNSTATALTQTTSAWMTCGNTLTVTHTTGDVAPVTKTVDYGTVQTNLTGSAKCWITRNLGASQQATAATDATEASAGWYWQFNRKQGYKHDGTTLTPAWTITSINESSDWLIANDPCSLLLGSGWRLPTYTEWNNADVNGSWNNYNQTYASVLKLHAAGYLNLSNGALYSRGSSGYYWSITQVSSTLGWGLYFGSSSSNMSYSNKALGFNGRCLRD